MKLRCATVLLFSISSLTLARYAFLPTAAAQAGQDIVVLMPPLDGDFLRNDARPSHDQVDDFFNATAAYLNYKCPVAACDRTVLNRLHIDTSIRERLYQDPTFARQILGQKSIIFELWRFLLTNDAFTGSITLRFRDWSELLRELDNIDARIVSKQPHIIAVPSSWVGYMGSRNLLTPVPDVAPSGFVENTLRMCSTDGGDTYIAVPWILDLRFLYYDRARFPTPGAFDNRSQFLASLRQQSAPQGKQLSTPYAMAANSSFDLVHSYSMLIWGGGGDWNSASDTFLPQLPAQSAMQFLKDLRNSHSGILRMNDRYQLESEFLEREVSSLVSGPWLIRGLRDRAQREGKPWHQEVGFVLPPFNTEGNPKTTFMGGIALGVTPNGASTPGSVELLKYLTQGESPERLTQSATTLFATQSAFEAFAEEFLPADGELRDRFIDAPKHAKWYPVLADWARDVEKGSKDDELFHVFNHIREGREDDATKDFDAWRERLEQKFRPSRVPWIVYGFSGVAVVAVVAVIFRRFKRLKRRVADLEGSVSDVWSR